MTDVLAKYYPIWEANCRRSIEQLSDKEGWDSWCDAHHIPRYTDEERAEKIRYYTAQAEMYAEKQKP